MSDQKQSADNNSAAPDPVKPLDRLRQGNRRPAFRSLAWAVIGLIAGFFGWAAFAQLDEVAVASGEVIPIAKVKVVQHLEGGIIQRLDIVEGTRVTKDQVLVQLNVGGAGSTREGLQVQLDSLSLSRARLRAESAEETLKFPADIAKRRPDLVAAERDTFEARKLGLKSKLGVILQQSRQRELEVKELQARRSAVLANLKLERERMKLSNQLLERGLTPRMEHLEIRREIENLNGEAKVLGQAIPRSKSALAESAARVTEETEAFRRRAIEELNRVELQIARSREGLDEASDRVRRTEIRSPIDGIIKNLRFNTIGGVVRPGEPIMEIVPVGDKLVVQARLSPVDRGYVQEGQKAVVKISTYDFVRYGSLDGVVERIAADTNADPNSGQPFYEVVIRTDKTYLGSTLGEFPITPGMQAIVDIHTGTRSVMNYLIKPVLKLRHEAFRER